MKESLTQVYGIWYIDPIRFLQFLNERVSLITERIAVPGVDHSTTEALRGRRIELITLIQQLTENTNGK
jgi:hypothetical protein